MANILVVGGAGGVGLALVDKLVARGETVNTTVLNKAEAARVFERHSNKAQVHQVDLSDADAALIRLREVISAIGHLDAVAVCAAIAPNGPVEITSLATFRKMFEVNCLADVAIYQAAMPALRKSKGRIVFISSASGKIGLPFVGAYTASKFALEGVCDVMRREAADQGVKISLIEPGGIRTEMLMKQQPVEERLAELGEEDRARYAHLYHRFNAVIAQTLETSASTPEQVADVLIEALDATDPEPRYAAGEDAKQMIDMARTMSDRESDRLYHQMFSAEASEAIGWAEG
jgi:NAD(P)-dependent dehydrogenase (short-subunit alcohol dehydrogenase family)